MYFFKRNSLRTTTLLLLFFMTLSGTNKAHAFVTQTSYSYYDKAGFFSGIWHGLLAPYSLIARWIFTDISMYAISNIGWFYDAGFLLGIAGSLPIGWIAAIFSTLGHFFL